MAQIHRQLTTVGFLHLANIPAFPRDEHNPNEFVAFDESQLLNEVRRFHRDATPEDKRGLLWRHHNPGNRNIFRGMSPFVDNDQSHKELFDMGLPYELVSAHERRVAPLQEPTPFPRPDDPDWRALRAYFEGQFQHRLSLGLLLIEYIALGLGLPREYFRAWFERDSLSTWRTIWYLPRGQASPVRDDALSADSRRLTTPAHSDSGFLTILSTLGFPGLQVLYEGSWRSVRPRKGHLVVNLGDMFERITGGALKATRHRVLDIGRERFAQPFFLDPKYSQRVPMDVRREGAETIVFGEWLVRKMKSAYKEWEGLEVPGEGEAKL